MARNKQFAEEVASSHPKFIQICAGNWTMSDDGDNMRQGFSIIGLTDDGRVFQYRKGLNAWVQFTDRVLVEL